MIDELVSERMGLDDINRGFDLLKAGAVARTVIVMNHKSHKL